MPDLVKALKSAAKSHRHEMEEVSAVTEAQRLIADKGAEDMGLLREMGMASSVVKAMNEHAQKIELEDLEKKYGKVFAIAEIKSVALKYALKFLKSDQYRGTIDPAMLQSLKAFFSDNGMEMNKALIGHKCYVLAPANTFELLDRPVPVPPDPILFYKLDDQSYRLIHKWGSDLTLTRRITGWKYATHFNYWLTWFLPLIVPGLAVLYWNSKLQDAPHGSCTIQTVAAPILLVAGFIISLVRAVDKDWGGQFKNWATVWDDPYKPKR